ncbi:MAG: hypothetical protein ABJC39_05310 [Chloroflexota bacterium]
MGQKRPAMDAGRRRDARVYRRLAALARALGWRGVTSDAVHHWVTAGLLPKATTTRAGFGGRVQTIIPTETACQLEALCRYRLDDRLGRYDLVGAQLWLDGFDTPTRHIRDPIAREFLRTTPNPGAPEPLLEDASLGDEVLDRVPALVARQAPVKTAMAGLGYTERIELVEEIRAIALEGAEPLEYGVSQLAGLTDEATASIRRQLALASRITRSGVASALEVTDGDLVEARAAFQALEGAVARDQHRSGRTRAKVRLAQFVFALMQDQEFRRP